MSDLVRCASILAAEDIFQVMGPAALKARVNRMSPGQILKFRSLEFYVDEDRWGQKVVVQMTIGREAMDGMVERAAEKAGCSLKKMSANDRSRWMDGFFLVLRDLLRQRYDIEIYSRIDAVTLEKVAYAPGDVSREVY